MMRVTGAQRSGPGPKSITNGRVCVRDPTVAWARRKLGTSGLEVRGCGPQVPMAREEATWQFFLSQKRLPGPCEEGGGNLAVSRGICPSQTRAPEIHNEGGGDLAGSGVTCPQMTRPGQARPEPAANSARLHGLLFTLAQGPYDWLWIDGLNPARAVG